MQKLEWLLPLIFGGMMKRVIVAVSVLVLGACSLIQPHYTPQQYSTSGDNTKLLKKLGVGNINVGPFTKTAEFDNSCQVVSGVVDKPDNTGFEGYIRKALIAELKQADMFDDITPKITLTGDVEKLSISTWRNIELSSWDITVRLNSSNGQSVVIFQHYDFNAGHDLLPDCQQIADHYMYAVQKTLGKLIDAPEFPSLVTP
jgi:hypothetical protein